MAEGLVLQGKYAALEVLVPEWRQLVLFEDLEQDVNCSDISGPRTVCRVG